MATNCGLQSAQTNRVGLKYIQEDPNCFGKLKTTGNVAYSVRPISFSFEPEKETKISEEIRADRMTSGEFELSFKTSGSIETEFSAGSIDDFLAGMFSTSWTKDLRFYKVQGNHVDIPTTNTVTITSPTDYTPYFPVGRIIKLEGWNNAANNTYAAVTGSSFAAGVTTLTFAGTPFVVENGNEQSAILDANDALILSTAIQADATGFHSNGGNAFTTAVANGQLKPGGFISVSNLGAGVGTLVLSGQPAAQEILTISDGERTYKFQFVSSAGTGSDQTAEEVLIGATTQETGQNLRNAINSLYSRRLFGVSASESTVAPNTTVTFKVYHAAASISGTITNGVITNFSGYTNSTGLYKIISASDDRVDVSPAPEPNTNTAGDRVVIKGSHVSPPDENNIVPASFQFEPAFTDIGLYEVYKGNRVGEITLTAESNDFVMAEISLAGTEITLSPSPILSDPATATQIEVLTTPTMNTSSNVKFVNKDGAPMPLVISSFEMTIGADLRPLQVLSSKFPVAVNEGRLTVEVQLQNYFTSHTSYQEFLDHVSTSMDLAFEGVDGNSYVFSFPNLSYSSRTAEVGGIDEDVIEELSFTGHFDPTSQTSIKVSRFSSVLPPMV